MQARDRQVILKRKRIARFLMRQMEKQRIRIWVKITIMSRCLRVTAKSPKKTRINVHFIRCKKMVKLLVMVVVNQLRRKSKNNRKEDVRLCPVRRRKTLHWTAALKDGTKSLYHLTRIRLTTEGSCRFPLISFKHRMS